MNQVSTKLLKAAITHFQAKKEKSEADLLVYLENPVGVGEHADVTQEIINKVEDLDHAVSCMKTIGKLLESSNSDDAGDEKNE